MQEPSSSNYTFVRVFIILYEQMKKGMRVHTDKLEESVRFQGDSINSSGGIHYAIPCVCGSTATRDVLRELKGNVR